MSTNYTGVVLTNILPVMLILKHSFLCISQSPVQLDDFDSYIKDMAKDSDYKFSLQFEVSGEAFSPCCDWQAVGMVRSALGPFSCSMAEHVIYILPSEGGWCQSRLNFWARSRRGEHSELS